MVTCDYVRFRERMQIFVLVDPPRYPGGLWGAASSEPRIDGLTLQCQDTEHAFMGTAKRFLADETFKSFDAQGKLPACEGSLGTQAARTQALQILGDQVFRPVDDAQILGSAALDGGLSVPAPPYQNRCE